MVIVSPEIHGRKIEFLETFLDGLNYSQTRKYLSVYAKTTPRFLYKFRSLDSSDDLKHLREIVVESKLWLSSPNNFNDPFDMSYYLAFEASTAEKRRRFKEVLRERGMPHREIGKLLPKLVSGVNPEFVRTARESDRAETGRTGVCSFAGDPRSVLMWSHYALKHQGVCLVFESARDPKTFLRAFPVQYSTEYPVLNWFTDFRGRVLDGLLRKDKSWCYEKEFRIVQIDGANRNFEFSPKALRSIILGCCVDDLTLGKINDLLGERTAAGMSPISIYRCHRHERLYKLVVLRSSLR